MYLDDRMIDSGALARRLLAPANNLVPVNLLTRQQASLEDAGTAGWAAFSAAATITRDTTYAANGTASLLLTATGTASCLAHLSSGIPVSGSRVYTALASIRSGVGSRSVRIGVTWYDAAGTKITDSETGNLTPTATFTEARLTVVSPSNAATARVTATLISSGSANDTTYFDRFGLWEGAGGSWVNGGERLDPSTLGWYWDESVGRRLFVWDTINNRWQMTYGDTGWRDVSATMVAGFITSNPNCTLRVRRLNSLVEWNLNETVAGTATGTVSILSATPAGFAPTVKMGSPCLNSQSLIPLSESLLFTPTALNGYGWTTARHFASIAYQTTDAWPTSLPGTASGSIPNL